MTPLLWFYDNNGTWTAASRVLRRALCTDTIPCEYRIDITEAGLFSLSRSDAELGIGERATRSLESAKHAAGQWEVGLAKQRKGAACSGAST